MAWQVELLQRGTYLGSKSRLVRTKSEVEGIKLS